MQTFLAAFAGASFDQSAPFPAPWMVLWSAIGLAVILLIVFSRKNKAPESPVSVSPSLNASTSLPPGAAFVTVSEDDSDEDDDEDEGDYEPSAACGVFTLSRELSDAELAQFEGETKLSESPWCIDDGSAYMYRCDDMYAHVDDYALLVEHMELLAEMGVIVNGTVLLIQDSTCTPVFQRLVVTDSVLDVSGFLTDGQRKEVAELMRMDAEFYAERRALSA